MIQLFRDLGAILLTESGQFTLWTVVMGAILGRLGWTGIAIAMVLLLPLFYLLLAGLATPTEAGALGVVLAILITWAGQRLKAQAASRKAGAS